MARVTSATFQREFGRFRTVAQREAVIVTNHGRADLVVMAADEYTRLRNLDRTAMPVSDLSNDELTALERVEIPAEARQYDHEM